MRICNDSTASCLSENFIQPYDRNYIGIHKITKHIARADRRQLVHIAHHYKACAFGHRFQQGVKQNDINH